MPKNRIFQKNFGAPRDKSTIFVPRLSIYQMRNGIVMSLAFEWIWTQLSRREKRKGKIGNFNTNQKCKASHVVHLLSKIKLECLYLNGHDDNYHSFSLTMLPRNLGNVLWTFKKGCGAFFWWIRWEICEKSMSSLRRENCLYLGEPFLGMKNSLL